LSTTGPEPKGEGTGVGAPGVYVGANVGNTVGFLLGMGEGLDVGTGEGDHVGRLVGLGRDGTVEAAVHLFSIGTLQ